MTISKDLNNNSPIGFFDSGVGGLTVLSQVKSILPNENIIYYGDTLNMPYGDKSKEQLLEYSNNIFKFFEQKGCKAVVMACNTTSSVVYADVVGKYSFELYPIVQSVAGILSKLPINRLGIFATKATIESGAYQSEIAKYNPQMQVFAQYCPDWVHIVENNSMNDKKSVNAIKRDLELMMKNSPDKIVLGCTHYPFLLKVLTMFESEEMFIDPALSFARFIKSDLSKKGLLNPSESFGTELFYVSSSPNSFRENAKLFYDVKDLPELLTFNNIV